MVFVGSTKVPFFSPYKLKVSLAAQTLSNSVAVALRTLQDVGYAEFKDSEATSEFIEVMQHNTHPPFEIHLLVGYHKTGVVVKCEFLQDYPVIFFLSFFHFLAWGMIK